MSNIIRNQVFISYSHKDDKWLERIQTYLKPLVRSNISIWSDNKIPPGSSWKEEITKALETAKVAILLVSSDFLASEFVHEHELPKILEASKKEGLTILWLALSTCPEGALKDISKYQAVHDPKYPLDKLSTGDQNVVLAKLYDDVSKAMEKHLYPSLPDFDEQLGAAISKFIEAVKSPYGTRGVLRRYEKGSIYLITEKGKPNSEWPKIKNDTAFRVIDSLIGRRYESLNGTGSKLGFPLGEARDSWKNTSREGFSFSGRLQDYEGGKIYQSERFGAHAIYEGPILKKFREYEKKEKDKGREMTGGILGFPIDEQEEVESCNGAKGTSQRFIYGYIIDWSGGTFWVQQGFYDLYQTIGKWSGVLGFPLSDEEDFVSAKSNRTGVIQFFENGCTQWDSHNGQTFYIHGSIYKKWEEEKQYLGFALNSATDTSGSQIQQFEGGVIECEANGSVQVIR